MSTEDRIHVGREAAALLQKLGLEPSFVKELHLTPNKATVTVFKRDENGAKYMEPTTEYLPLDEQDFDVSSFGAVAATEVVEYAVRT
jgi:hypothetical protein